MEAMLTSVVVFGFKKQKMLDFCTEKSKFASIRLSPESPLQPPTFLGTSPKLFGEWTVAGPSPMELLKAGQQLTLGGGGAPSLLAIAFSFSIVKRVTARDWIRLD